MSVSQSVARPVRTATQIGAAAIVVEFVSAFLFDLSDRQYAAAVALLTLVFGWAQVVIENHIGKGFLRQPEPPANPVDVVEDGQPETRMERYHGDVDERGAVDSGLLVGMAAIVIVICGIVWLIQNLG